MCHEKCLQCYVYVYIMYKFEIYLKLQVSVHKKYAWISAYCQYSITTIGVGIRNKIKVETEKASPKNRRPDQVEKHDQ